MKNDESGKSTGPSTVDELLTVIGKFRTQFTLAAAAAGDLDDIVKHLKLDGSGNLDIESGVKMMEEFTPLLENLNKLRDKSKGLYMVTLIFIIERELKLMKKFGLDAAIENAFKKADKAAGDSSWQKAKES